MGDLPILEHQAVGSELLKRSVCCQDYSVKQKSGVTCPDTTLVLGLKWSQMTSGEVI